MPIENFSVQSTPDRSGGEFRTIRGSGSYEDLYAILVRGFGVDLPENPGNVPHDIGWLEQQAKHFAALKNLPEAAAEIVAPTEQIIAGNPGTPGSVIPFNTESVNPNNLAEFVGQLDRIADATGGSRVTPAEYATLVSQAGLSAQGYNAQVQNVATSWNARNPNVQLAFTGLSDQTVQRSQEVIPGVSADAAGLTQLANQIDQHMQSNLGQTLPDNIRQAIIASASAADPIAALKTQTDSLSSLYDSASPSSSSDFNVLMRNFETTTRLVDDPRVANLTPEQRRFFDLQKRATEDRSLEVIQTYSNDNTGDTTAAIRQQYAGRIVEEASIIDPNGGETVYMFLVNSDDMRAQVNSGAATWLNFGDRDFVNANGDQVRYSDAATIDEYLDARPTSSVLDPNFAGILNLQDMNRVPGLANFNGFGGNLNDIANFGYDVGVPTHLTNYTINGQTVTNPYSNNVQVVAKLGPDGRVQYEASDTEYFNRFQQNQTSTSGQVELGVVDNQVLNGSLGAYYQGPGTPGTPDIVSQVPGSIVVRAYRNSPLALDLNGDGVKTDSAILTYDIDADGQVEEMNELSSSDGWLAWDANQDGVRGINSNGSELFGSGTTIDGQKFSNGFDALRALAIRELGAESVASGSLSAESIKELEDKIGLRVQVNGEDKKLSELGIESLNLHYEDRGHQIDENGVDHRLAGSFEINGEQRDLIDLFFAK